MRYACRQFVMALISHLIIAGCWLAFCIYWLVSALTVKAVVERKTFGSSLAYRIPIILGSLLLWGPDLHGPLSFMLTPHADLLEFTGAVVCVVGIVHLDLGALDTGRELEQHGYFQKRP